MKNAERNTRDRAYVLIGGKVVYGYSGIVYGIARACHLEDKGDMFSCHWKTGAGQNAANGSENVGHVPPLKARGVPVHAGIGG